MVVADTVEQRGLGEDKQEGKNGIGKRAAVEYGIQGLQDQPVEIIVLQVEGRRRYRVEEHIKFQDQGVYEQ